MADFTKRTYYFKLVGKINYVFRVDYFGFSEKESIVIGYFYNSKTSIPFTEIDKFNQYIEELSKKYGLKYVEITDENEIESIKLLYES